MDFNAFRGDLNSYQRMHVLPTDQLIKVRFIHFPYAYGPNLPLMYALKCLDLGF
jgi:hypothetical protein